MSSEECLFWFTENQHAIAEIYNESWDMDEIFHFLPQAQRHYTLMDMENSGACEIDKRCRTKFNNKRPKQTYNYKIKSNFELLIILVRIKMVNTVQRNVFISHHHKDDASVDGITRLASS